VNAPCEHNILGLSRQSQQKKHWNWAQSWDPLIVTSQNCFRKKTKYFCCSYKQTLREEICSQCLLQRRRSERASERENERESKIVITKVFEAVFARVQGAKTRRFDDHRVWNKSSINFLWVIIRRVRDTNYYQGAADMVLGLSWGQLALVLGASVALFGKVSSYDFVSSSGLTFRS